MSVCLSVRTGQVGSHPAGLQNILCSGMLTEIRRDKSSLLKIGLKLHTSRESLRAFVMGHYN
jgi:hypothetical protein